jgi:hypothetical protein
MADRDHQDDGAGDADDDHEREDEREHGHEPGSPARSAVRANVPQNGPGPSAYGEAEDWFHDRDFGHLSGRTYVGGIAPQIRQGLAYAIGRWLLRIVRRVGTADVRLCGRVGRVLIEHAWGESVGLPHAAPVPGGSASAGCGNLAGVLPAPGRVPEGHRPVRAAGMAVSRDPWKAPTATAHPERVRRPRPRTPTMTPGAGLCARVPRRDVGRDIGGVREN